MNVDKWDALARSFMRGEAVPANGWEAWRDDAIREADTIRGALPPSVQAIVEIGCGVGRLTPHLAERFERVVAVDTSAECLRATAERLELYGVENVIVTDGLPSHVDAAVVWNLYDEDWSPEARIAHYDQLTARYPIICFGSQAGWTLERS